MAESRSTKERIAELDKKIEQIKAQKKAILQRDKQAERKARIKRLIQLGAIIEANCGEITKLEEFKKCIIENATIIKNTQTENDIPKYQYPDNWADLYPKWLNKEISGNDFMRLTGIKPGTFYYMVAEWKSLKEKDNDQCSK